MARFGGRMIVTEEDTIPLPSIVNGNGTCTIRYLNKIRAAAVPQVQWIADEIHRRLGLTSAVNSKKSRTARAKCVRPATLGKYPWFKLCHLRDYLRFRTHLNEIDDFLAVMRIFEALQSQGVISLVKIDQAKLAKPSPYGWRMVATDMRIAASGLMVEHYMTFGNMIDVNEDWLHKVYEKWRSGPPLSTAQLARWNTDTRFSRSAYRELLLDGIVRSPPGVPLLGGARKGNERAILGVLLSRL